jgi:Uma2 family endonuclease
MKSVDFPYEIEDGKPEWELWRSVRSSVPWSEQTYLDLDTARRMEFTDGEVEYLPWPTLTHQRILVFLIMALDRFARSRNAGVALLSGIRVQLRQGAYREPDVVFMSTENMSRVSEKFFAGADLVMEIVGPSEEERDRDLVQRRSEYAQAGIPEYWIVDRELERITVLVLDGSTYAVHGEFGRGEVATSRLLDGFAVDVTLALEGGRAV